MPEPLSFGAMLALSAGGSVLSSIIGSVFGGLFGGDDKILYPIPGQLPDTFVQIRFIDPTVSEEHYVDVQTGITYRWSYEGDRFKESGSVSPEFLAVAQDLYNRSFGGDFGFPTDVGAWNSPMVALPGGGSMQASVGDWGSLWGNALSSGIPTSFLPTGDQAGVDLTRGALNLGAQIVGTLLRQVLGGTGSSITRVIQNSAGRLQRPGPADPQYLLGTLTNFGTSLVDMAGDVFEEVGNTVTTSTANAIDSVALTAESAIDSVTTFVNTSIESALGGLVTLTDSLFHSILDVFEDTSRFIMETIESIRTIVSDVLLSIQTLFLDVFDVVSNGINNIVDSAIRGYEQVVDAIFEFVTLVYNQAADLAAAIADGIQRTFDAVVNTADSVVQTLRDTLGSIPGALERTVEDYKEFYQSVVAAPLFTDVVPKVLETLSLFSLDPAAVSPEAQASMASWENRLFGQFDQIPGAGDMLRQMFPDSPLARLFVGTLVGGMLLLQVVQGVSEAKALALSQTFALDNPYRLPTPEQLVEGFLRGFLPEARYDEFIRRQGLTSADAEMFKRIRENLPAVGDEVHWLLRGFINEGEFRDVLTKSGWSAESIAHFLDARFVLPPVQDLITMAVREVFSPEVAETFGQFEDFPQAFADEALKQGISPEWAKRYWGAHWSLPSPSMGFEMLHRRIISPQELNLLLKALDIMPFWRDKLVQISYNPLTRVDIRRMHKLGILDEAQVFAAYLDIGYNEVNATHLLNFTRELNKVEEELDDIDLKSLTRSNILRFYADGIIRRDEAGNMLAQAGYADDSINLLLESTDLSVESAARSEAIAAILEQAQAGLITFEQAEDALAREGLETVEMQRAMSRLVRLQAQRVKQPSRSDLDRFLKNRIIDDITYQSEMGRLGYSAVWSQRYMQLVKLGQGE